VTASANRIRPVRDEVSVSTSRSRDLILIVLVSSRLEQNFKRLGLQL